MSPAEKAIYINLLAHPGEAYITLEDNKLYYIVDGGMLCLIGADFKSMNEAEINAWICDSFI